MVSIYFLLTLFLIWFCLLNENETYTLLRKYTHTQTHIRILPPTETIVYLATYCITYEREMRTIYKTMLAEINCKMQATTQLFSSFFVFVIAICELHENKNFLQATSVPTKHRHRNQIKPKPKPNKHTNTKFLSVV